MNDSSLRCNLDARVVFGGGILLLCTAWAAAQPPGELLRLPPLDDASTELTRTPAAEENSDEENTAAQDANAGAEDIPQPDIVEESVEATIVPWYAPDVLFDDEAWECSFELGINGTTGNTQTMSFRVGADSKHKTECNTLAASVSYARTQADGRETQNNALATIRDDWDFRDSPWSMFIRQTTEYDEFKAFDVRVSANSGLGYFVVKQPTAKLKGRFGAGFSHEIGGPNNDVVPEAVFGADVETKLTKRQKVEATIDYLPEWADWMDYRIESRASWSIQLDTDANLSLKLSAYERYDSTPEGRRPNDLDYALLLLWKL